MLDAGPVTGCFTLHRARDASLSAASEILVRGFTLHDLQSNVEDTSVGNNQIYSLDSKEQRFTTTR
ncbi:MAG: hypothetical protein P8I59_03900 [Pseudomonadales bacterium]|jgi:hypothetical protein|nr:hypothetical protein [Pseudomonadales bacterium]